MSSQRRAVFFVPATGIEREVITEDISRYLGNDALVSPGNYKNHEGEQIAGYFITAYPCHVLTTYHLTEIKADSARWGAERALYQANRGPQGRGQPSNITPDVRYHNSRTKARQQPPPWDYAAPPRKHPIPSPDGAVGPPSRSLKEPLGVLNSKQRLAPPLKDKAGELSATAFPSFSTAERQSNQFKSNVYGAELQSNWIDALPAAALASSQPSELQPAKSHTFSYKTEYVSDNATLPVSNFELFDDQTPSGDVADKADRWFRCLKDDFVLDLPEKSFPDKKDRIRIAVLDTGICGKEKFKGTKRDWKRITYKSFVTGDPNPTEPSDPDGHGTHVALLLLRVAQNADIYVAKVSGEDGLHKPKDIADAIRYATKEWKVHIISMSFGFDRGTPDIGCIGDQYASPTLRKQCSLQQHTTKVAAWRSHTQPAYPT